MSTITLTDEESDVSIELEMAELARQVGDEHILRGDEPEFAYLAALALETHDDENYSVQDTLMEFIRNTSALERLDADDCNEIEVLLHK